MIEKSELLLFLPSSERGGAMTDGKDEKVKAKKSLENEWGRFFAPGKPDHRALAKRNRTVAEDDDSERTFLC